MLRTHEWGHEDPHRRVIPCLVVFTVCIPNRAITGPGSELVDLHRLGLKLIRRRCSQQTLLRALTGVERTNRQIFLREAARIKLCMGINEDTEEDTHWCSPVLL